MKNYFRIHEEELDFYPIEYLQKVSDLLKISPEDLILTYGEDEVWELKDLGDILISEFNIIPDDFKFVSIGHSQLITINNIPIVWEQNASPIGFWMSIENLKEFEKLLK